MGFKDEFDRIARDESRSAAARNIFNEIEDWRGTKRAIASKRWIWELLQNAKDCAKGKPFTFSIVEKGNSLTVRHDAGPFTMREIVALVEGDSSKHRRAEDTTGRFGKGFLVSHVVSTDVQVHGILSDKTRGKFSFVFRLRRDGSEGEIRHNIEKCRDALDNAEPHRGDSCPTEFIFYITPSEETRCCIDDALRDLKNHAPYLFSFLPGLKRLTYDRFTEPPLTFAATERHQMESGRLPAAAERVTVCGPDSMRTVLLLTLLNAPDGAQPQIAFLLDRAGRIVTPSIVARVFQDLPLYGTSDFDLPAVLNLPSTCDVDSDRACPNITKPDTHRTVHSILALLPSLAEWTTLHGIGGVHLLAEFGISEEMKKEPQSARLWEDSISQTVKALSTCKLVECQTGFRRVDDVTFPEATWLENVPEDMALLQGMQQLLSHRGDSVPNSETIEEWIAILAKWRTISGVPSVRRISLTALFSELQNAGSLSGFRKRHAMFVSDDVTIAYLCDLFQVAADYCERQKIGAPPDLKRMPIVLNQNGKFRESRDLRLDGGIDSVLKDISKQLELDFREKFVHLTLTKSLGSDFISQLCGDNAFTVENAVAALVNEIESRFSSGRSKGSEGDVLIKAAVTLLVWFAGYGSHAPADLQSFPLLCADGKLHASTEHHDTLLAPTALLQEDDRIWANLFPQSMRLSDKYLEACESLLVPPAVLVSFLAQRRLASAHLLVQRELSSDAEYFSDIYAEKTEPGHRIESVPVTDIAGFTRLLNEATGASSSGDWDKAKQVLSFILCFATVMDDSWRSPVLAACMRSHGCVGSVSVFPCSWLAKLKHQHWVPNYEVGRPCEPLSSRNINELWQRLAPDASQSQQARDFLALHFGVDRLEMAIRSSAGDDAQRRATLRDELAAVVDTGVDPSELRDFVERHRVAKEINTRNGRLGRIVEALVAQAFEREGFEVTRTGVGSDFMVRPVEAKDLEWDKQDIGELRLAATYNGVPVEFLVEVKATRGDAVRVSWRQAETATNSQEGYVLCVVDFGDHLDLFDRVLEEDQPTCDLIAGCLALVPTIAQNLATSVQNLNSAMETSDPGVEVERGEEIRFRISQRLWQKGSKLSDWAIAVRYAIAKEQAQRQQDR